jgi:hypothetical protein
VRVLLDECVPRKLGRELPGHEVRTVVEVGWGGMRNGTLLRRAAGEFDVFLTVDSNLEHQQNRADLPLPIIVLNAFSNDIEVLRPLMARVRDLLPHAGPGSVHHVGPGLDPSALTGGDT